MAKRKTQAKEPSFEQAMERLEEIVKELEEAELPLEKSLKVFEEGVRLSRLLNKKLSEAEEKVEILLGSETGAKTARPFDPGEEDGPPAAGEAGEEDSDQGGLPF